MGKQTRSKCAQREYTVGVKLAGLAQVEMGHDLRTCLSVW